MARREWRNITVDGNTVPIPDDAGASPPPPAGDPGGPAQLTTSITDDRYGTRDISWTSSGTRKFGKFYTGDCYMVVPTGETETLVSKSPAWDPTHRIHGCEKNHESFQRHYGWGNPRTAIPTPTSATATFNRDFWGFDDLSKRFEYPGTVAPWDVIQSTYWVEPVPGNEGGSIDWMKSGWNLCWNGTSGDATYRPHVYKNVCLYIIPEEPPANALPPSCWNAGERLLKNGGTEYYTIDDILPQVQALPKLPVPAGTPDFGTILGWAARLAWPALGQKATPTSNFEGNTERACQGADQCAAYGGDDMEYLVAVLPWLCLDKPDSEKLPVAAWVARMGIDRMTQPGYVAAENGTAGGGLTQMDLMYWVAGAHLLGETTRMNFPSTLSGDTKIKAFKEFQQIQYIPNTTYLDAITAAKAAGKDNYYFTPHQVGQVAWFERYSGYSGPNPQFNGKSYQVTQVSRHWPGFAFYMMANGITGAIDHQAYFDYFDAWMGTRTGTDRVVWPWVGTLWDSHRASYSPAVYTGFTGIV